MTTYTSPDRNRDHDPLRVITVDPNASCGWAMWDAGNLDAVGWVKGTDTRAIAAVLQKCQPDMLVIERPFGGPAKPPTMRAMWLAVARWTIQAEYLALPIEEVWPATWQSYLPGWKYGMKREQVGQLYGDLARGFTGRSDITIDECASVCVGWWYWGIRGVVPTHTTLKEMEQDGPLVL